MGDTQPWETRSHGRRAAIAARRAGHLVKAACGREVQGRLAVVVGDVRPRTYRTHRLPRRPPPPPPPPVVRTDRVSAQMPRGVVGYSPAHMATPHATWRTRLLVWRATRLVD